MKLRLILVFCCFLIANVFLGLARAQERLDLETQSTLIKKLESVLEASEDNQDDDQMLTQKSLALRLADLYSERSRLLTVDEEGKGKEKYSQQILEDQNRALKLYQKSLPKMKGNDKAKVNLQAAHLLLLQNKNAQATNYLEENRKTKEQIDGQYRSQAAMQLADISFSKGQFAPAEKLYEESLASVPAKNKTQKDYVSLRLAWCAFNQERTAQAVQILTRTLQQTDKQGAFAEEASKDLATFLAKKGVTAKDVQTLMSVSPANAVQPNLIYLANELDRTAKKDQAVLVWAHVDKKTMTFMDQVERQVRLARIQYDVGDQKSTVEEIQKALVLLVDRRCLKDNECVVQQQNLRNVLTDWGKASERKPTSMLLNAYDAYIQTYDDEEVAYWAGLAAMKTKDYTRAYRFFSFAIHSQSLRHKFAKGQTPQLVRIFEGSLLSSIEAAELSKDKKLHLESLITYLQINPQGEKRHQVKYQIAHTLYELNRYQESSPLFQEIALDKSAPADLRKKSSDLYFDTLALQKNDEKIESDSVAFAKALPSESSQLMSLNRKSVLNQSAKTLQEEKASQGQLREQLNKLNGLALGQWPEQEKKKILQNKLLLAQKLKDLEQVQSICQDLLALKSLNAEERNDTLSLLAWSYEMRFQFVQAVTVLQKVKVKKNPADHVFKMALLSELAGKNPTSLYREVLAISRKREQRQYASHQLIASASNPESEFQKHYSILQSNPQLFASASIRVFEKNPNSALVQKAMRSKTLRGSFEGSLIQRSQTMSEYNKLQKKISQLPRVSGSDAQIKSVMNAHMNGLKTTESFIMRSAKQKDLVLQVAGLSLLQKQNSRIAKEILNSKMPRGLSKANIAAYQAALKGHAEKYLAQSQALQDKATQIWKSEQFRQELNELQTLSGKPSAPGHRLAKQNLLFLNQLSLALGYQPADIEKFTQKRRNLESQAISLKRELNRNPFNFNNLEELKDLETALGSGPMVAYLNTRLQSPQGGRN